MRLKDWAMSSNECSCLRNWILGVAGADGLLNQLLFAKEEENNARLHPRAVKSGTRINRIYGVQVSL